MDPEVLTRLALAGDFKMLFWALLPLLLAVINGFLVRISKPDAKLPFDLDARWRPVFSVGFGLAYGALSSVVAGTPWRAALVQALVVALVPIVGHVFLVDVLRKGNDMPLPSALKRTPSQVADVIARRARHRRMGPTSPPGLVLFLLALGLGSCSEFRPPSMAKAGSSAAPLAAPTPARCQSLQNKEWVLGGFSIGFGTAGLGGGLGSLAMKEENKGAKTAMSIVAAVAAGIAAGSAYVQHEAAATYVGEGCGAAR